MSKTWAQAIFPVTAAKQKMPGYSQIGKTKKPKTGASKKLSKNSSPEAHFHQMMREHHREECRNCTAQAKYCRSDSENYPKSKESKYKALYFLHKHYVNHHDQEYKKAMAKQK